MLFPTSVVGSMPRPRFVRDLLRPETHAELGVDEVTRRMDAAVAYVVAMQETAGLDIISDGEWRRLSYIGVIADICEGFEVTFKGDQPWTTVVAPLHATNPGIVAREALFVREHSRCEPKVALPSPYLLGLRMWDEGRSAAAYPTREAFMQALVPVLRNELAALRDAGIHHVQFDDPHLCLFVDPRVRRQYGDPEREMDLCVGLLNDILDGFDDLDTAVHLCRRNKARQGWVGEGGYGPIMPHLARLNVSAYMLEFAIPVAGDYDVLTDLPDDRRIGLGCVDCRGAHIDTPDEIVARVEGALGFVDADRLFLHPDCGFAPGSAADIPIDEAYAKLSGEVQAARLLREKHG
ncbi:cobalamin-independent methionine synthase II family protein [Candidatus Poribacteria bacterium]|nr:cobalamin-independent methionine synthase II family protein [Candidatus Poribacteria bacterium]